MLKKIVFCLTGFYLLLVATGYSYPKEKVIRNNNDEQTTSADDSLQQNTIAEMKKILGEADTSVSYFSFGKVFVACKTDKKTTARIKNYASTLLEDMQPYFKTPVHPIKIYVFASKDEIAKHVNAICEDKIKKFEPTMGFYNKPTYSGLCSMQWGLGWMGDIIIRGFLANDWNSVSAKPNKWFVQSFESMLYNSFRTPEGQFKGLNVASYYRPQAQQLVDEKRIIPLQDYFTGHYDESKVIDDAIRVQGREFLAYIHSQGYLMKFYKKFLETCTSDSSGIMAFEQTMGKKINELEKDWLQWLMKADGEIGDSEMATPFPVMGILIQRKTGKEINEKGILAMEVCPYSPALRGGIQNGDRILKINNTEINSKNDLIQILNSLKIDTVVRVFISRNNKEEQLTVKLDRLIDG